MTTYGCSIDHFGSWFSPPPRDPKRLGMVGCAGFSGIALISRARLRARGSAQPAPPLHGWRGGRGGEVRRLRVTRRQQRVAVVQVLIAGRDDAVVRLQAAEDLGHPAVAHANT